MTSAVLHLSMVVGDVDVEKALPDGAYAPVPPLSSTSPATTTAFVLEPMSRLSAKVSENTPYVGGSIVRIVRSLSSSI